MLGSSEVAKEKDEEKVLGLIWNTSIDSFVFRLDRLVDLARSLEPTKRNLLKIVAKLFDPMGLLSPVIIPMKCLFQHFEYLNCDGVNPSANYFRGDGEIGCQN